ncbi:hypothetical protein BDN72DRAFT_837328 [Pluteus cervinus]|uniref:Uncharacterized protein n=1 Tax=Pluteus cervinus TaxID=181527 RepID=A0ACD3B0U9_9AGAR|nr:hypothetical protein BDN72DRAFT_837328 [Pluteus cervinus]
MSLSSTGNIKVQLTTNLGQRAPTYFEALKLFVAGQTSRAEFEETVRQLLDVPSLVQLHNALIISLFDATVVHRRPPTPPPPAVPKLPPRKRRRTLLPYQGAEVPDSALTLRSSRLKRWALAMGKRERERLQSLSTVAPLVEPLQPRQERDEIARERGVVLLQERGEAPGSRLPIHLHSTTHAPTIQHIADRINLICAQNNLGAPARSVPSLMNLACEAKLKQLITHALTLTSTSNAISSINPSSSPSHSQKVLSASAFQSLFTLKPSELPNKSAAAMQLSLDDHDEYDEEDELVPFKDREAHDERWQLMALLGQRSTVKDMLREARR